MRATILFRRSSNYGADTLRRIPAERVRFRPGRNGRPDYVEAFADGGWYTTGSRTGGIVCYYTEIEISLDPALGESRSDHVCEVERSADCPGCEVHER